MNTSFALILAFGMLITGSINTISTKLADIQNVTGTDPTTKHKFNHPFVQAALMFLGESLCLLTFWSKRKFFDTKKRADSDDDFDLRREELRTGVMREGNQQWSPIIFLLPACCDMTGTSLMYVGLNLTHASVFQMLRGSVVLFTGIFSVIFLGRRLYAFHWIGMILVLTGTAIVGIASVLEPDDNAGSASNPLLGDIIIVFAQIITAVQMVLEEKLVSGKGIPALQAVGWEGVWGFSVLSMVLVGMYYAPGIPAFGSTSDHFENTGDALIQISRSGPLAFACAGNVFSIAFFNFFGLSVTKYMSATHRMVLDSLRTIVIWGVSLIVGWQSFSWLQLIGFIILLTGTMVYNEVGGHLPYIYYPPKDEETKRKDSISLLGGLTSSSSNNNNNNNGEQSLLDGVTTNGEQTPTSPNMDDWFSPKLTHYTQGRAM